MSWDDLVGQTLPSGWVVKSRHTEKPGDTGGHFSVCFLVEKSGTAAFMKAFDLETLFRRFAGNPQNIQRELESINFEIRLLDLCKGAATKAVVIAIDRGTVTIPSVNLGQPIEYLIFQLADQDARRYHNYRAEVDAAINLQILKHAAHGLRELHGLSIAHQDLKPSNVLLYKDETSKLADLGRSSRFGDAIWHDALLFAGDSAYAPIEVLYKHAPSEWHARRFSSDLYMLGSFVVFLFSSVNLTAQILTRLQPDFHPRRWTDSYEQVVPYLRVALRGALENLKAFQGGAGKELQAVVRELCDPDPLKRGSPRIVNVPARYSLQRYASIFERLALQVRLKGP